VAAIRLTRTHRILVAIVVAGAVIIAGIGFAGSYAAVRSLALDKGFGWFANVFPIGVDAGIVVLLALDLLLTWLRIPFPLLRQTAWLLTAATIAFNGAAAWPDPLGVGMHAIIPVLFVVSVEAARHAIGRIADITADKHMEGVRLTRWLLSPVPTFRLWRRMKLWELRSYEETIRREQDRLVYRSRLRARYGVAWRRKAPIEAIMPLRLAKYGVPLSETADAGLEAAGIEIGSPVRKLEAARVEALASGEESGQGARPAQGAQPGQDARPAQGAAEQGGGAEQRPPVAAPANLVKTAPAPARAQQRAQAQRPQQPEYIPEPTHEQGFDPAVAQQQQAQQQAYEQQLYESRVYEQQAYEQQEPYDEMGREQDDAPQISPWFAAPQPPQGQGHPYPQQQAQQQAYEQQAYQQQSVQQPSPQEQQQPQQWQPLQVPNGPNRTRPLSTAGLNVAGPGGNQNGTGPVGAHNGNQNANQNGFNGRPAQAYREPPYAAQPEQPRQQREPRAQQPQAPQQFQQAAEFNAIEPEFEPETYPVGGLTLPEGISPSEAYFSAYRRHVQSTGERPGNARQLARILETEFGGTAPEQRELITAVRKLHTRYQTEAAEDGEYIP
jgi:hypothetical protein